MLAVVKSTSTSLMYGACGKQFKRKHSVKHHEATVHGETANTTVQMRIVTRDSHTNSMSIAHLNVKLIPYQKLKITLNRIHFFLIGWSSK